MYDFHKTTQDPTCGEFQHHSFKQNRPDLLVNIKRKAHKMLVPVPTDDDKPKEIKKPVYDDEYCQNILTSSIAEGDTQSPLHGDDDAIDERLKTIETRVNSLLKENDMLKRVALNAYKKQMAMQGRMENLVNTMCEAIANESSNGDNNSMIVTLSKTLASLANDGIIDNKKTKVEGVALLKKEKKDKKKITIADNSLRKIPLTNGYMPIPKAPGVELQRMHSLDLGSYTYDDPMVPRYTSELDRELGIPLSVKMNSFDKAASSVTAPYKGDDTYRPIGALERLQTVNTFDSDLKLLSRMSSINSDEGLGSNDNNANKRKYSYQSNDSNKYSKMDSLELTIASVLTNIDSEN